MGLELSNVRSARRDGLLNRDLAEVDLNSAVFPGQQGGPLEHVLATDSRRTGINVVSGGTDTHVVLVDLRLRARRQAGRGTAAPGGHHRQPQRRAVDPRPPMISSGVRIGTPARAARGFGPDEFADVADVIAVALRPSTDEHALDGQRQQALELAARFPLYPTLAEAVR
jgi:glycine hydroxymethyltransferase